MAVLFNGAHEEIRKILHTLPITIMMINQNTAAHGNNYNGYDHDDHHFHYLGYV